MNMNQSTTGTTRRVVCDNQVVWCSMDCFNCRKSKVIYSNKNETSNTGTTIHIVESPKHRIDW